MKTIIDLVIKALLSRFASKETIDYVAEQTRRFLYGGVDWLIAFAVAYVYSLLNAPPDDIPMIASAFGDQPVQVITSTAIFVWLGRTIRYAGPILLKILLGISLPLAMFFLLASVANATGIHGPSTVGPYTLARFDAEVESKSSVMWDITPAVDPGAVIEDGNRLTFVAPPGRYVIELIEVGPTDKADKPFFIQKVRKSVEFQTIPGPGPNPTPPGPAPPPPLPTPIPDDEFQLGKFLYAEAMKLPAVDRAKCVDVAKELRAKASALAAGGIKDPNALMVDTRSYLDGLGGGWSTLRAAWSAELKRQSFGSKPKDKFVTAWNAAAGGIEAAK